MSQIIGRSVLGLILLAGCTFAADLAGVWTGQQQGRRGETEDVAFRFKVEGQTVTGKLFGDEFDLPITEGSFTGEQVRFVITVTNYYSGNQTKFSYTGTVNGNELELTRERVPMPDDKPPPANRAPVKQTLKLKRLA